MILSFYQGTRAKTKALLQQKSYATYRITRIAQRRLEDLFSPRYDPIIVYTMAKVGTKSTIASIKKAYKQRREAHLVHWMCLDHIYRFTAADRYVIDSADYKKHIAINTQRRDISRTILSIPRQTKVISVVRDPIARNISFFFNFLEFYTGHTTQELVQLDAAELTHPFLKQVQHAVPLLWFDMEVKQVLGIDVYAYPFPHQQGYQIIRKGKVDLLIMKLETDDQIKEQAIAEFLQKKDFQLFKANVTDNKVTGHIYRDFLKQARIPSWYVEALYRSKYMRHFYTEQEIDRFRARWLRLS